METFRVTSHIYGKTSCCRTLSGSHQPLQSPIKAAHRCSVSYRQMRVRTVFLQRPVRVTETELKHCDTGLFVSNDLTKKMICFFFALTIWRENVPTCLAALQWHGHAPSGGWRGWLTNPNASWWGGCWRISLLSTCTPRLARPYVQEAAPSENTHKKNIVHL